MNMKRTEDYFCVNRKSREISHTRLISNRRIGRISESELASLVQDERLIVFENHTRDDLEMVPRECFEQLLNDRWAGHISTSDDFYLADFTDGYCYLAEHWKGEEGCPVVILYYHH